MSVSDAVVALDRELRSSPIRLLVTEKRNVGDLYRPVGFLEAREVEGRSLYSFAYLREASQRPDFRPLLGFSDANTVYRSEGLFPLFAERIMDPRRPDRPRFLAALDLSEEAGPLEVLARSGGRRMGDGILLIPVPRVDVQGHTSCVFLVHGVRHIPGAPERIEALHAGDALRLEPQPENPVSPHALLVTEDHAEPLGWVPDALLSFVHQVRDRRLTVVRVNPSDVGTRLRLLVRLEGRVDPGVQPFVGPEWATAAE